MNLSEEMKELKDCVLNEMLFIEKTSCSCRRCSANRLNHLTMRPAAEQSKTKMDGFESHT
jgi:hypothetical protein